MKAASLDDHKSSGPVDSVGSDSLLGSLELMMDKTSPPGKGDSLMVLDDLRRKRDDLSALDLSDHIKNMAFRLRADREEQRYPGDVSGGACLCTPAARGPGGCAALDL